MSDQAAADLLRSDRDLVLIEAAAGCGKTYQGAAYACDVVSGIGEGRLLILAHTHAACGVFAERTKGLSRKVEIRTIDALIAQVATAYHKSLGLPAELSSWAWRDGGKGFEVMAAKVAAFLNAQPMVARALASRYPIIVCDEHQDSSADQHSVVVALHRAGSKVRIFGDPLQRIYGANSTKELLAAKARWNVLRAEAAVESLRHPHRWNDGCQELGKWIQKARRCLEMGHAIDLGDELPASLSILYGDNISPTQSAYQLPSEERKPLDRLLKASGRLMILAPQNKLVESLRAFWGRRVPIWEGHTREALATLVAELQISAGDAEKIGSAMVDFMSGVATGFTVSSHGDRLCREIREGCSKSTRGAPENIQQIARLLLKDPSHIGVATALDLIHQFIESKSNGFEGVMIDHWVEFRDGIRLGQFQTPDEAFSEIARKRSYARPMPPALVLSSIHKAKGLECDNAIIVGCEKSHFGATDYARCKLYVALSRAKKTLTLVIPRKNPSSLFVLPTA